MAGEKVETAVETTVETLGVAAVVAAAGMRHGFSGVCVQSVWRLLATLGKAGTCGRGWTLGGSVLSCCALPWGVCAGGTDGSGGRLLHW